MKDKVDNSDQAKEQIFMRKSPKRPAQRMDSPTRVPRSPDQSKDRVEGPVSLQRSPHCPARTKKPASRDPIRVPLSPVPRSPVRVPLSPERIPCITVQPNELTSGSRNPERAPCTPVQSKKHFEGIRSPERAPNTPTRPKKGPERSPRTPTQPKKPSGSPRSPRSKVHHHNGDSSNRGIKPTTNHSSPSRAPHHPSRLRPNDKVEQERTKRVQYEKPLSPKRDHPRSPRASVTRIEEQVLAKQLTRSKINGSAKQKNRSSFLESKGRHGGALETRRIDEKVRIRTTSGSKNGPRRPMGNSSVPGAVSVLNGEERQVLSKCRVHNNAADALAQESTGNSRRQSFEDAIGAKERTVDDAVPSGPRDALDAPIYGKSKKKDIKVNNVVQNKATGTALNSFSGTKGHVANKIGSEAKETTSDEADSARVKMATAAQEQIDTLEQQVQAKERLFGWAHSTEAEITTPAQSQVEMLEQQILAKERLFGDGNPGEANRTTTAQEQVELLEQQDGQSDDQSPNAIESSQQQLTPAARNLSRFEQNVRSKARASGGRAQLEGFECEINAKSAHDPDSENVESKRENKDVESLGESQGSDLEEDSLKAGLAVAVPVELDPVDNSLIPSAVEYDPAAKPSIYRNRRVRLYTALVIFLLALLGIGIGVGITLYKKNAHDPTNPLTHRENLGIREAVEKVVGTDVLVNEFSPHSKALRWITYHDPQKLTPAVPNFVQRYILAYFYFATSEARSWNACNPPKKEEDDSCNFERLDSIDSAVRRPASSFRWLSGMPECDWAGLVCDDFGQIRAITLVGFDLTGQFPAEVIHLPFLQALSLGSNSLRGPLPKDDPSLRHLINIEIQNNAFTGVIPQEWYESQGLQNLNVAKNQFTGQLSSGLRKWSNMRKVYFQENRLTGVIPTEFGELNNMSFIRLDSNLLKGTIPTELGNMSLLTVFQVQGNDLSGTIPTELGRAGNLEVLRLQNNARLTGKIPGKLFSTVDTLEAYNCNLSGDLTEKFFLMKKMVTLRIHNNKFSGRLPPNLGKIMPAIAHLRISGNMFTGSIPDSICDLRGPFALNELVADCAPSSDRAVPEISCPLGCCSECCNAAGENCLSN